jgi:UDP-N-acetylmuramoylalanine--D-glutamate ligase
MTPSLHNLRVTVAGLGKFGGGVSVARWLVAQGARVLVTDQAPADKLEKSVHQLDGLPITFRLGEHRESDFTSCDLLVVSPAVPPTNPFLLAAERAGVPVTTEIALFLERCRARTAAVTGTKGKSTTTALLEKMLATRHHTWLAGNIGISLLDQLDSIAPDHVVCLELSSFMLHWLGKSKWSPDLAILTMIGADHLDWHGTLADYHAAKANLVRFQKPHGIVVVDATHEHSRRLASLSPGRVIEVPRDLPRPLSLRLPGSHNQRNAQLALHAAMAWGVGFDDAQRAVETFEGLPHRLHLVHESHGVRWVNDSIATIPEAAVAAGKAFDAGTVIQIVGGSDKGLDLTPMCVELPRHCKAIFTIGTLGPSIAKRMTESCGSAGVEHVGTLELAVARARAIACPGDVVLLSPGCASYDQFSNFEARGNAFADLARAIAS